MPDKRELGERIKRLRLSRDLTLKKVERKAKVSATHISEIERGLTSPTVGAMSRIAMALGVPASRLIERDTLPAASVVRGRERRTLVDPDSGARYVSLSGPIQQSRMSVVDSTRRTPDAANRSNASTINGVKSATKPPLPSATVTADMQSVTT